MGTPNTKTYNIGPQDGWVLIIDSTTTQMFDLHIVSVPSNTSFRLFASGGTAPTAAEVGFLVDQGQFDSGCQLAAGTQGKYWIKVPTWQNSSKNQDGRTEICVFADGGVLQ